MSRSNNNRGGARSHATTRAVTRPSDGPGRGPEPIRRSEGSNRGSGRGPEPVRRSNRPGREPENRPNMSSTRMFGGAGREGRTNFISDEDFRDHNAALRFESTGNALKLLGLNLFENENRQWHRTDEYEQEGLIVRRGQKFTLACTFDRSVSTTKDIIILKFVYGKKPKESKGTLVRVPVIPADKKLNHGWDSKVVDIKDKTVTVEVMSDPDSKIGTYSIHIETKLRDSERDFTKTDTKKSVIVLFNAWRKEDVVYMADEKERCEYVLNQTGRIWVGRANRNRGRPWNFGQFEAPVLEVTLGLLDTAGLADSARHSAVAIIRCMTAMANSSDLSGVLTGKWAKEYPADCTKPWEWAGSVAILEEYHQTGRPVRFGQCWVFSGLLTTLLRALGIPTRSVTNFQSAHDNDSSMTIDMHFDENDEPMKWMNDSIWNFHVWNESFLRRVDLPDGYDGWQAHDATPQESSEGMMRCGPAPLKAIKEGHVYLNYDIPFIFGEVNGDKISWTLKRDGNLELMSIDRNAVGKKMSTKAVGSPFRQDVTDLYKYPEGSSEERRVVESVNKYSTRRELNIYNMDFKKEVEFELVVPDDCLVKENMIVGVKVKNTASAERTVIVHMNVASAFYTGVVGAKVKGQATEVIIGARQGREIQMTCTPKEYEKVMAADSLFNLTATCRVLETNNCFAEDASFNLSSGKLTIDVEKTFQKNTFKMAIVTFTNLSDLKLHNAKINVEGCSMIKQKKFSFSKEIPPGAEVSVEVPLLARTTGDKDISATFVCDEVSNIFAEASVTVV